MTYQQTFEEGPYYLSGPMTGYPEFNYPMFNSVTEALRKEGCNVVSPAETEKNLGHEQGSLERDWDWWMRHALLALLECRHIIMLPGWYTSRGARAELSIALDLKFPVWRPESFQDKSDPSTFIGRRFAPHRIRLVPIDAGLWEF